MCNGFKLKLEEVLIMMVIIDMRFIKVQQVLQMAILRQNIFRKHGTEINNYIFITFFKL